MEVAETWSVKSPKKLSLLVLGQEEASLAASRIASKQQTPKASVSSEKAGVEKQNVKNDLTQRETLSGRGRSNFFEE